MINKSEKINFRYTGLSGLPNYISKEELFEASKDCLSYSIIETDRKKLLCVLSYLDSSSVEQIIVENKTWQELEKYFFGFLMFNKEKKVSEIILFVKHGAPKKLLGYRDVVLLDDNLVTYGSIINVKPLIIEVELGNVWGYVKNDKGIEDVEICSPTENLYDWKPIEEFSKKPFIRKPD